MSFKGAILFFVLALIACGKKDEKNQFKSSVFSGWYQSLVDTNVHVSEGELLYYDKKIYHFFRLDSSNKHVSSNGSIAYRSSSDNGRSWSNFNVAYNSVYDDRNVLARVINNTIVLIFRRYDPAGFMIDLGYITTKDLKIWSSYKVISRKIDNGQPFGEIIDLGNNTFSFLTCDIGKAELFTFRGLLENIESRILYSYPDKFIDEPYLAKVDENNFFILARDEFHPYPNDSSYFLLHLAGINEKPTYLGRSEMNSNQVLTNRTAPYIKYISYLNKLLAISVQRKYFLPTHDSVFFYLGNKDSLLRKGNNWQLIYSIQRPNLNKNSVTYGYPKILELSQNEYFGIISERYNSSSINYFANSEYVGFYSFYLKLNKIE